ncbi:AAA family ATPase [Dankookia rubra]|uniref:AAA family ATPase n=1 Tax=Dankookia rubra TaxID=1442381 RepID=A0A4R5QBL9_9PROT|nr:ATP-binding protein [Dankookia rubra]TDH60236.1 AAA family ATPase [Dankookia rubra]
MARPAMFDAVYRDQAVPHYRGNPLNEALPDILTVDEAVNAMMRRVRPTEQERALPPHLRRHATNRLRDFLFPLTMHLDLSARLGELIRDGYSRRNPHTADWRSVLQVSDNAGNADLAYVGRPGLPGLLMALIGPSGIGKTSAVDAVLATYPQVIRHLSYKGQRPRIARQIVWLKLTCPPQGSTRELCCAFLDEVDRLAGTSYGRDFVGRGTTAEAMRRLMAKVALLHGVGLLVVDEVQCLSEASSGGSRVMLNFWLALTNGLGIPIVSIGTPKSKRILGAEWQHARRGVGQGDFILERLSNNDEFEIFCSTLWKEQFLQQPAPLTRATIDLLYDRSQGVLDLVVKLFMMAQRRAIDAGHETLEHRHLTEVYDESFKLVHGFLEIMRQGGNADDDRWDQALDHLDRTLAAQTDRERAMAALHRARQAEDVGSAGQPSEPKRKRQRKRPAESAPSGVADSSHTAQAWTPPDDSVLAQKGGHEPLREAGHIYDISADLMGGKPTSGS